MVIIIFLSASDLNLNNYKLVSVVSLNPVVSLTSLN